jgi:hypothetical protein
MKLYDVPRDSFVRLLEDARVPEGHPPIRKGDTIYFDHVDGMYSYCMDKDKKNLLHIAAFTEVEVVE